MPDLFSAGANIVGGLLTSLIGGGQRRRARKALDSMQYPTETLAPEIEQNQNLANQMAGQGLPSEQYNKAMRDIQRNQLFALRGARSRRGGLMSLPSILQSSNDSVLDLDAADAAQKIANRKFAIGYNDKVAGLKSDLFDKNIRQKYNRDYDYNQSVLGAGNQNSAYGLDKGIAGAGELLSSLFSGRRGRKTPRNIYTEEDEVHI